MIDPAQLKLKLYQLGNAINLKDFFWELVMLIYGNLICLKN